MIFVAVEHFVLFFFGNWNKLVAIATEAASAITQKMKTKQPNEILSETHY